MGRGSIMMRGGVGAGSNKTPDSPGGTLDGPWGVRYFKCMRSGGWRMCMRGEGIGDILRAAENGHSHRRSCPMDEPLTLATKELIRAARSGDRAATDRLFEGAYEELRQLAHVVRRRGAGETLNTTALVHEAYFKLSPGKGLALNDRAHFVYIVARAMRQVLVDSARKRMADKRGGGQIAVTLDGQAEAAAVRPEQIIVLEEALAELEAVHPRRAKVVECRFFGGLSVEETAAFLGISTPTVKRDWRVARAWLAQAIDA